MRTRFSRHLDTLDVNNRRPYAAFRKKSKTQCKAFYERLAIMSRPSIRSVQRSTEWITARLKVHESSVAFQGIGKSTECSPLSKLTSFSPVVSKFPTQRERGPHLELL